MKNKKRGNAVGFALLCKNPAGTARKTKYFHGMPLKECR